MKRKKIIKIIKIVLCSLVTTLVAHTHFFSPMYNFVPLVYSVNVDETILIKKCRFRSPAKNLKKKNTSFFKDAYSINQTKLTICFFHFFHELTFIYCS